MKNNEQYAGFALRLGAYLLDRVGFTILMIPVMSLLFEKISDEEALRMIEAGQLPFRMSEFIFVLIVFGVIAVLFWMKRGATPAKMLLKMKIVDAKTGEIPTPRQSTLRYIGYMLSTMSLGLGFLWMIVDDKKQGWHDKLSGTVVILTNKTSEKTDNNDEINNAEQSSQSSANIKDKTSKSDDIFTA